MPITPSVDAVTGRAAAKKKRKRRKDLQNAEPERKADLGQRIAAAEAGARSKLPTGFIYAAAAAAVDDLEAARAAAIIAREVDVPPVSLVRHGKFPERPTDYFADPVSGGPMTLQSMQNIDQKVFAAVLAQALAEAKKQGFQGAAKPANDRPVTDVQAGQKVRRELDPDAVTAYVRAMGALPGRMKGEQAVGAALALIRDNVELPRFHSALKAFADYNGETGPYSEEQILAAAHIWARDKGNDIAPSKAQVQSFLNPQVAAATGIQKERVKQAKAFPDPSVAEAFASGTPPSTLTEIAEVGGSERVKREQERLQRLQSDMNGQPGRYDRLAQAILSDRAKMELAEKDNWVGKMFGGLFHGLDVAWHKVAGAGLWVTAPIRGALREAGGPQALTGAGQFLPEANEASEEGYGQALEEAADSAADVFFMRERPGDVMATDMGFEEGTKAHQLVSMGSELLAGWFLDPFVMAGQLKKATALRRLLVTSVDDPTLKGTGLMKFIAVRQDPEKALQKFMRHKVRPEWADVAGGSKDMDFVEWLTRMGSDPSKHDLAAELPRGVGGRGEGVSREVLNVVRLWTKRRGFTPEKLGKLENLPDDLLTEVADIWMVGLGAKPSTSVGGQFKTLLDDTLDEAARGRAKTVAERQLAQQTGLPRREVRDQAAQIVDSLDAEDLGPFRKEAFNIRAEKVRDRLLPEDARKALPEEELQPAIDRAQAQAERIVGTPEEMELLGKPRPLTFADALGNIEFTQRGLPITRGARQGLHESRLGLQRSRFWRSKAAEWMRPFFEMVPGARMDIEAIDGGKMFSRWLQGWEAGGSKVFTPGRISTLRSKWTDISTLPRATREIQWEEFVGEVVQEAYSGMGLPPEVVGMVVDKAKKGYGAAKQSVDFSYGRYRGIGRDVTNAVDPVFETQLLNTLILPNPQAVRNSIRDAVGSVDGLRKAATKKYGREIEDLTDKEVGELLDSPGMKTVVTKHLRSGTKRFTDRLIEIWKPTVLLRPAWTTRVVLIEENMRAFIKLSSGLDRLLGIKGVSKVAKRVGVHDNRVIDIAGTDVPLPRLAGLLPDDEAVSAAGRTEALSTSIRYEAETANRMGILKNGIKAESKEHLPELVRVLNRQVGQSALGRRITEMMLQRPTGPNGQVWNLDTLADWVATDTRAGRLLRQRKGTISPNEAVERAHQVVEEYTKGNRAVLEAILAPEGPAVSRELLQRVWPKVGDRPQMVHAQTVDHSMLRSRHPLRAAVDAGFNTLARRPTDYLSRQPLFKALYTRERERLLRQVAGRAEVGTIAKEAALPSPLQFRQKKNTPLFEDVGGGSVPGPQRGYVYHATTRHRLPEIKTQGLKPKQPPKGEWADGATEARLYFGSSPTDAIREARIAPGGGSQDVLLRVRKDVTDARATAHQGGQNVEFWGRGAVPRDAVEVLRADGKWYPLTQRTATTTESAAPQVIAAAEKRAKNYAITETKRVMYSLTERSRFADAHSFITPFFAPWQESLQVWSSLLYENPAAIGHARLLAKAVTDNGTVKKNEDGEWVVAYNIPTKVMVPFGMLTGLPGKELPEGFEIIMRAQAFNLFLQNTLNIPVGGGAALPVPLPGFGPGVQPGVQAIIDALPQNAPMKRELMAWAFEYGPGVDLIPKPWMRLITAAFPGIGDKKMLKDATNFALDYAAASGMTVARDADQKAAFVKQGIPEDEIYTVQDATRDGRKHLGARAFLSWFSPAAPEVKWPQDEIREEYLEDLGTLGYDKAISKLKAKYPDRPDILMLAISHSAKTGGPLSSLPATETAEAILNNPEFAEAAARFPELALAFIPEEARDGKFSGRVYQQQLADARRIARNPAERVDDLQRRKGWEAAFELREAFAAATADVAEDSGTYKTWRRLLNDEFDELAAMLPAWAIDREQLQLRDPELRDHVQFLRTAIKESPLLAGTGFGKALRSYFAERDAIELEMKRYDINSVESTGAKWLGLDKRFEKLVEETKEKSPDFARVYNEWLGGDLRTNVETKRDSYLRKVGKKYLVEELHPWEAEWKTLNEDFRNSTLGEQQARAGLALREWGRQAEEVAKRTGRDPQEVHWNGMTEVERQRERMTTAMKPYVFLTPFEKRVVLGLEVDAENEALWEQVAQDRIQTQKEARDLARRGESESKAWDAHEKFVASLAKRNPKFKKELRKADEFGATLFEKFPVAWKEGPTDAAFAWQEIEKFVKNAQQAFDKAEINSYDDDYDKVKTVFEDWVVEWEDYSETFRSQWDYLDSLSSGRLVDLLLPSTYFPRRF